MKQLASEFMAAATVCSDFGAQEEEICHYFYIIPFYLPCSSGARCHDLSFFEYLVLSWLFHSPPSPSSKGSWVPLHFLPLEWYRPQTPSWITALSWWRGLHNWMKLQAMPCGATQDKTGHSREFWQNMIHWRRKWQTTPVYLPWKPHELFM